MKTADTLILFQRLPRHIRTRREAFADLADLAELEIQRLSLQIDAMREQIASGGLTEDRALSLLLDEADALGAVRAMRLLANYAKKEAARSN